ncbi:hypothetical protein Tco_0004829 [Tanacetum coccineum]
MFMASLTSEDPIYDEAGPSYDSNNPFEVQDHDAFVDHMDEYHDVHEMQNDVQHNYVVDSDADYTSDSNIIPYDQYVEDNEEHVVQCNASSVRNDALMSILDEMHEHGVQSRLTNKPDMLINDSVTSELARYKELVGEYEKRAKKKLLKSELHSAQILLSSTVDHYKSKTEEVKLLKKDFKQKEDKFLEEFLDLKKIKDKIEDRLYKQGQSAQTVHMLCQPKSFYDEKHKVAIGYKKQAQSAEKNAVENAKPSKENLLATFAPQRNLTPEQIFWSIDDNNRKKAETLALKPISALTVYPPNTPVKLVPRILPTKSQVKINLYVLTQLFTEFDKTCKTRITPSGLTEGERGFEQTKRCYLTEVIPFFKTLKEHFVGVQTALFKEVKEMEEIFDQMNNEVDKNSVDKQCAEIEKKNLLIENENLIVNCLSTQLLYDVAKSRCLDLEADVSKVHDESKLISKLEREYLNLQLKYQHLQESFDNKKSQASQEAPDFRSFFKIKNLEHQIQEKDNVIGHLKDLVANVNDRSREPYSAVDVTALIEQNNCDRLELEKVKQHYKELFDSIKILRAHTSEKTSTITTSTKVLAPGMYAIDVKPIPHPLKNNRSAHLNYIGHLKESVETVREIVEEARVVKPLDSSLNYACRYTKLSQDVAADRAIKFIANSAATQEHDHLPNGWSKLALSSERWIQEEVLSFNLKYLTIRKILLTSIRLKKALYQAILPKSHFKLSNVSSVTLKDPFTMGLWYPKDNAMSLTAYADADHAGCQDSIRSPSEVSVFLEIDTDEQIVPRSQWLTIGKSNLLFNAQKIQKNPIFQISVDILKNTNFFQALTASANVPILSTCNSSGRQLTNQTPSFYANAVGDSHPKTNVDHVRAHMGRVYSIDPDTISLTKPSDRTQRKSNPAPHPYGPISKYYLLLGKNNNIHRRPDLLFIYTGR